VSKYPLILQSKLPDAGTTIFTVMSRLAQEQGAINLSQGYPDFDVPPALRERVEWHMRQGQNQYAPLAGVPELLEQIALKAERLYGCSVDPQRQVVVTPGATEALFCAITAVVHPGDEVILFDPAYDTYEPAVRLNGGSALRIPLVGEDFRVDWDRVRDAINPRTRLLVLNSPHNPTGSVWRGEDIDSLRQAIDGTDIVLISDEVYEHICFDGLQHQSLLRHPDLAGRAFCVFSFGKTFHVTGWRTGYCIAPDELMREFLRVHQFINFSAHTPMQYGFADFLRDHSDHYLELPGFYQEKRDLFRRLLEPSGFRLLPSRGTYFQLADYSRLSDEADCVFAERLTREHKVACIPVSVFYEQPPEDRRVRFCFAKHDDTLRRAADRLCGVKSL
jgi:methionine aminotransferase